MNGYESGTYSQIQRRLVVNLFCYEEMVMRNDGDGQNLGESCFHGGDCFDIGVLEFKDTLL